MTGSPVHLADWPLGVPGLTEGATSDSWDEEAERATELLPAQDHELENLMELVRELAEAEGESELQREEAKTALFARMDSCRPDVSIFTDLLQEN